MIQSKNDNKNNTIFRGFDLIEINLVILILSRILFHAQLMVTGENHPQVLDNTENSITLLDTGEDHHHALNTGKYNLALLDSAEDHIFELDTSSGSRHWRGSSSGTV